MWAASGVVQTTAREWFERDVSSRAESVLTGATQSLADAWYDPTNLEKQLVALAVFGGKKVVNLTVEGAPHKGAALAAERRRLKCAWVLYLGDDENDEDAFALAGDVVPVRIGLSRQSHGRYYLRTQKEIDELLRRLIVLREAENSSREQNFE